jgi:hypothetical protein
MLNIGGRWVRTADEIEQEQEENPYPSIEVARAAVKIGLRPRPDTGWIRVDREFIPVKFIHKGKRVLIEALA